MGRTKTLTEIADSVYYNGGVWIPFDDFIAEVSKQIGKPLKPAIVLKLTEWYNFQEQNK